MTELSLLLAPLSDDSPCGEDMSFSPQFDLIQAARREDDPALNQGDWVADLKTSDWPQVIELCEDILLNRSKDLRVAAWYGEALLKVQGFPGLTLGCDLLQGLFKHYWQELHPSAEDDLELRIGTMLWFVGQIEQLVRTVRVEHRGRSFAYIDYETARIYETAISKNPDLEEELPRPKAGTREIQDFLKAMPASTLVARVEELKAAKAAWDNMGLAVDERLGVDGPTFSGVKDQFENVTIWLSKFLQATVEPTIAMSMTDQGSTAPTSAHHAGPIQNRQQALQMLKTVADYFRQTEPHSPVAHLAQKAIDWGNMSLHDWLRSVVKDGGSLGHIEELLGLDANQNVDSDE